MHTVHINTNGITRQNGAGDGHIKIVGTFDGAAKTYHTHLDTFNALVESLNVEERFLLRCYFAMLDAGAETLAQKKAALENKDWNI